jgi:glycosyltransferase involved in cell wall biosynthesis
MPKSSVITINYNNRKGLEKTIASVITQTFNDYEYIVIDGGSDDGSADVIKTNADKITYWVSEKDKGIFNAQNKGIAKAKGEYLLFLNSGDYLCDTEVLNKVFSFNYSDDIIYGDMMIDNGKGKPVYGYSPNLITFEEMIRSTLWHPASFIKKSLFDKYGLYDETLKIVSDYEFFLKVLFIHNVSFRHIPLPVSVFATDGIGSSKENDALHKQERLQVQLKHFPLAVIERANKFSELKRSKAVIISNWLRSKPLLYGIATIFYKILKPFR